MYSSHDSVIGCLNDSNVSSTSSHHSWHEEAFVQLANKKNPYSYNILLIGTHGQKFKPSPIHSKMLSLFPPLVRWHRASCKPCTNMNVFRINIFPCVYRIHFSFCMLQIVTPIILASYLLCAHRNGGKTLCRSRTMQKMWYIGCHPHVIFSMQRVALISQSCIFFFMYSLIFWPLFSFQVTSRPMTILFKNRCSTYSNNTSNSSSIVAQL